MRKLYIAFTFILISRLIVAQPYRFVLNEMKNQARQEQARAARFLNGNNQQNGLGTLASDNFDVEHYRCEWEIDPAVKFINGKVTSTFTAVGAITSVTFDLSKNLTVDSVVYHGSKITFTHNTNHTLALNFPAAIANAQKDSVSIFYKGVPDAGNSGAFTATNHGGVPILWTLSEPYGAREWWPCKNGLADKADSIDIILTCPAAYRGSSNGLLVSDQTAGGKRTSGFKHRYPIASYLVAIACTNYVIRSHNVNINGRNLPFENWTYPESESRFEAEAYGVENALQWFSGYFGDYPFMNERYAQTQFGWGGGMEHQTNSFMGAANHLLQAHELGHQWFGDKSTCGSWKEIWVNEGFASFAHWLYFQTHDMPTYLGIKYEYLQTVTDEPGGSLIVPDADTLNDGRVFDWRLSYVKGSFVLHMLRGILGDTKFFEAVKQYSNDPAVRYGFARTGDVKRNFEQVSGRNLTEFFNDWVYGQGHPSYHVNWYVNKNGWLTIQLNQTQSHPSVSFFENPIQLRFTGTSQGTLLTLEPQYNGQFFYAKLNFVPDTVYVDPDIWVLSKNNTQTRLSAPPGSDIVKVYPNPAVSVPWNFSVNNPSAAEYTAEVFNARGQRLFRKNYTTGGNDFVGELPNAGLAAGAYTVRISTGGKTLASVKVMKL